MNRVRRFLLFLPLALLLPALASPATLSGTVKDPSGALVAAAQITIRNTVTGQTVSASTGTTGTFTADNLPPGEYLVAVQKEGFDPAEQRVTLAENASSSLSFDLKIAQAETTIEVTGKRSALANSDPNYRALRDIQLTSGYSVENLTLTRDVGVFTFHSGQFAFAAPVLGRVAVAVFTGEGSLLLKPAVFPEVRNLTIITGKQVVNEDFDSAILLFTDGAYDEIVKGAHPVTAPAHDTDLLRDFHRMMRHRNEYPRSQLEYLLQYENIPNVEAELLGELYNPAAGVSFNAYIHGRKH